MNAALDAVFASIEDAHPQTKPIDVAALVVTLLLTICAFSYLAKRDAPAASPTFAFFSAEADR